MSAGDPQPLVRAGGRPADLLRGYARCTTPGERGATAAWYRLRAGLEVGAPDAPAPAPPRLARAFSPSRVLAMAVCLFALVKLIPLVPSLSTAAPAISQGGAAGWRAIEGAGGMEGAGG
jgi:hypothetical protein